MSVVLPWSPIVPAVLGVCAGVDLACLFLMVRGCDAFLAGVVCLRCGFEAFSLGAGRLLSCCELGLFDAAAAASSRCAAAAVRRPSSRAARRRENTIAPAA
ncbi:MAG: hypothetical protein ACXWPI_19230 [Ktedonobacterales bacterium]